MSVLLLPVWYSLGMSIDSGASVRELTKLFVCWCAFTGVIRNKDTSQQLLSTSHKCKNTTQKLHRLHWHADALSPSYPLFIVYVSYIWGRQWYSGREVV